MDVGISTSVGPLPLRVWRITRLSLDYLLDTIALSRGDGDILDTLLLAATIEANVAPISQDPELQFAYATLDAAPPDERRRPVSINALAQSLGVPFETVRRRIGQLASAGACVIGPRGVYVPQSQLATPAYAQMAYARHLRLQRFYADLTAAGALPYIPVEEAFEPPPAAGPPVRVTNRLLSEYVMRFTDCVMARIGDPLTGLVLLDLVRANTEHLTAAELEAEIPVPNRLRRPISIARLAERLDIPVETVRRRSVFLQTAGFCQRVPQGLVVLSEAYVRPGLQSLIAENVVNLQRLFGRLARLGILASWDQELGLTKTSPAA